MLGAPLAPLPPGLQSLRCLDRAGARGVVAAPGGVSVRFLGGKCGVFIWGFYWEIDPIGFYGDSMGILLGFYWFLYGVFIWGFYMVEIDMGRIWRCFFHKHLGFLGKCGEKIGMFLTNTWDDWGLTYFQ